jgi:ferric-dicitrate binding protein FerR (iron transport regulator)
VADETRGQFSAALLEGSVEILDKQEQVVASLRPNQMVRLEGGRLVQSEMNNRDAYLWTNGIVSVTGVSFDEALKMLERAYGVNIEMRRSSVPEIHYAYLKFRISDGIEHALRILQRRCDFTYTYDEATGIYYIN